MNASENTWVIRPQPKQEAKLRLFCFPYAGAGASAFTPWLDQMPPDIELCSVQLPGRENRYRQPAFTDLKALAEVLLTALTPLFDIPFGLFGHSMGALIGFEVARMCRRELNIEPAHLLISACRPPHLEKLAPIHTLPDSEFISELRRFGGTPPEALDNPELMSLLLPTLRADFALCETCHYESAEPLECPISTFGGTADPRISEAELNAWQDHTANRFDLHLFPGDHFYMHKVRPQFLRTLVGMLLQSVGRPTSELAWH